MRGLGNPPRQRERERRRYVQHEVNDKLLVHTLDGVDDLDEVLPGRRVHVLRHVSDLDVLGRLVRL